MENNNTSENFYKWANKYPYTFMIPISRIIEWIQNYNKKYNYIWKYDNSICTCDCIGNYNSPPYCQHYNKLIRKKK